MTEEDYLHEQLRMLQESYEKASKPIVDRLVAIRSMSLGPFYVTLDPSIPPGEMHFKDAGEVVGKITGIT